MQSRSKRNADLLPHEQPNAIRAAIDNLRLARDLLRSAGSKNAADKAASAMKSAEGALRHARHIEAAEAARLCAETGDERLRTTM